jgi:hypothetical protein
MSRPAQPGKKVALGAPLDTTEEELDLAALVTPEDIEAARADPNLPPRLRALLAAERVEPAEDAPDTP